MSELNDDPKDTAAKLGLLMVLPEPSELFLDLDTIADQTHYSEMMQLLANLGERKTAETKVTASAGGNEHAYLVTDFLSEFDEGSKEHAILRIALQACLGSDRKRELLSLLRILYRLDRPPTVFFERPDGLAAAPTPEPIEEDVCF